VSSGRGASPDIAGPIVLVGISGAGKSATGRLLAGALGWEFLDLDEEVERRAGIPVAHMFSASGEPAFRAMEAEVTAAVRPSRETVVAVGGGWMDRPELRKAWPGAVCVWLQVSPATALARLAERRATRPLLAGPDPLAALGDLLARRTSAYARAEHAVATDGRTPEEVAARIREIVGL